MDKDFEFKPNSPLIKKDNHGHEYVLVWLPLEDYATTYLAAFRKVRQLETEIDGGRSPADLHHTLSKLWIFARELVPETIRVRAHILAMLAARGEPGAVDLVTADGQAWLAANFEKGDTEMDAQDQAAVPAMKVRSKWTCVAKTQIENWKPSDRKAHPFLYSYKFNVVTGTSDENAAFFASTPSGQFEMGTIHDDLFVPGRSYYLDLSPEG